MLGRSFEFHIVDVEAAYPDIVFNSNYIIRQYRDGVVFWTGEVTISSDLLGWRTANDDANDWQINDQVCFLGKYPPCLLIQKH